STSNLICPQWQLPVCVMAILSSALVLLVPDLRFPQLDFVPIRIQDPRELAVLVRLGSLERFNTARAQLRQQLDEIVDAVIDHEGAPARAEPLTVLLRDMPHGEAAILGAIFRPFEDGAAPSLQRHAQVLAIPGGQRSVVMRALEEDAADSGDLGHRSLLSRKVRGNEMVQHGEPHAILQAVCRTPCCARKSPASHRTCESRCGEFLNLRYTSRLRATSRCSPQPQRARCRYLFLASAERPTERRCARSCRRTRSAGRKPCPEIQRPPCARGPPS